MQVVVKEFVVERDRIRVMIDRGRETILPNVDVTQQRVEVRFLRHELNRFVGELRRVLQPIFHEGDSAFVIGGVSGLVASQIAARRLEPLSFQNAVRRKCRGSRSVSIERNRRARS